MKFEDVKVGQILEDTYGNRFQVLDIIYGNEYYPVRVKCIEFKNPVKIDSHNSFKNKNQILYVLKDRSMLLSIDDGLGKYIKENFYSSLALSNTLQTFSLTASNGSKRHYVLGRQSTVDNVTLTLSDMEPVKDNYLTIDNVRNDMIVSDGVGNKYTIIYYNSDNIQLMFKKQITGINGKSGDFNTYIWVPYDSNDGLSAKDFSIV
jgi:hypothetical protein|nr:MAG TPA: hypothetical protein [Bacteriophage sp.]